MTSRGKTWRARGVSATRPALLVVVVLVARAQWPGGVGATPSGQPPTIALDALRVHLPAADSLDAVGATWVVRGADGGVVGRVLRTSPEGDSIVGFSGPSDLSLVFDGDDRLVDVSLIATADTRDHVQQILDAEWLRTSFVGKSWDVLAEGVSLDAVSGATLTCRAMQGAMKRRLGADVAVSNLFPVPITPEELKGLPPDVVAWAPDESDPYRWNLRDADGAQCGWLLRTPPFADGVVGYQGPTASWLAFDVDDRVIAAGIERSFDNEPYVGWVAAERSFLALFRGKTESELASWDLAAAGVEGVSGATMTSLAVADGFVAAARGHQEAVARQQNAAGPTMRWTVWDVAGSAVLVLGCVLGLGRWRVRRVALRLLQCLVVGVLGLGAGWLLSQAMLGGWAHHGAPWRSAPGLVLLAIAALLIPVVTGRNVYCTHLCAHGVLQRWLGRWVRWKWRIPGRAARLLRIVPWLLLGLVTWSVLVGGPVALVDLEPFDAWVPMIAGAAACAIAVGGLAASAVVPMAYCKFGCPTGALLEWSRFGRRQAWSWRDAAAWSLVVVAWCVSRGGTAWSS